MSSSNNDHATATFTTSAISRLEIDLRGPQLRARAYLNGNLYDLEDGDRLADCYLSDLRISTTSTISRMEIDSM